MSIAGDGTSPRPGRYPARWPVSTGRQVIGNHGVPLPCTPRQRYLPHMPRFGKPGERIGYEVHPHPDQGPPLVLVHGFTASAASFAANIPALNGHFTVVTVDLLGHGQSDAPEDPAPYAPGPAIERITALLDWLGYGRVLLCGHSLGAAVCLRLALDAPARLDGLILINSMSAAGTPEWREAARPGMDELAARLREEGSDFLRTTRLYPAHSKRLDPRSRELLTQAFDQADPNGLAGTAESLVIDINSYERLGELAVPTLLVVGTREEAFARAVPDFVARMPEGMVRQVDLAEAGHAANLEQPEAFEAAVVEFARDLAYLPDSAPAGQGARRGGTALTVLGGALVLGGLALLAGSVFFVRGGDDDPEGQVRAAADAPPATATPTVLSLVAGTRSAGPGPGATVGSNQAATPTASATAPPATAVAGASVTPTATTGASAATQPALAATATRASTATATTAPPTATPTPVPPTATPSGPAARVSGPASAELNVPVGFVGTGSGGPVTTMKWSVTGGTYTASNIAAPSVKFSQAGCQTVTLTVFFADGTQKAATTQVAVGGGACP
ncbi:MAG: hypothetical protein C0506_02695 [Anaerolinea sp.]|nr:hypothetical protein [Anaerolinea sp.]